MKKLSYQSSLMLAGLWPTHALPVWRCCPDHICLSKSGNPDATWQMPCPTSGFMIVEKSPQNPKNLWEGRGAAHLEHGGRSECALAIRGPQLDGAVRRARNQRALAAQEPHACPAQSACRTLPPTLTLVAGHSRTTPALACPQSPEPTQARGLRGTQGVPPAAQGCATRTRDALGVRGQLRAHAPGGAVEQHHAAVRARRRHQVVAARRGVDRQDAALAAAQPLSGICI